MQAPGSLTVHGGSRHECDTIMMIWFPSWASWSVIALVVLIVYHAVRRLGKLLAGPIADRLVKALEAGGVTCAARDFQLQLWPECAFTSP